jgi:proteic killer suppression protein
LGAGESGVRVRNCQVSLDAFIGRTHVFAVIRSFRNRALGTFFESGNPSGLSVQNSSRVSRMLRALDAATRPEQLNLPGYHLHALQGARRWSLRVTGNWRMTFGWDGADAVDIDLEDYH